MHLVIWILSGALAGWLVGLVMKGRGYGLVLDTALGLLGITALSSGWLGHVLVSVIGGIILVAIARLLRRTA